MENSNQISLDRIQTTLKNITVPFRCPFCLTFEREANEFIEHIASFHFIELKKKFDKLHVPEDEMILISMNVNDIFETPSSSVPSIRQSLSNSSNNITNKIIENMLDATHENLEIPQSKPKELLNILRNSHQIQRTQNFSVVTESCMAEQSKLENQINSKYCRICHKEFISSRQVHKHLNTEHHISNIGTKRVNVIETNKKPYERF